MNVQVLFLEKQSDEEPIQSRKEIPIQEPQVVADGVLPIVRELDRLTFAFAEPIALHSTAEDLARDEFQLLQAMEKLGREEWFGFRHAACGLAAVRKTISLFHRRRRELASESYRWKCSRPG